MNTGSLTLTRHDWIFFGLRWVVLVLISLILHVSAAQGESISPSSDLITAFAAGALANILFVLLSLFSPLKKIAPVFVILGDWLTVGLFARLALGDPLLLTVLAGLFMISGAVYLGLGWGILQSLGVIVASLMVYLSPFEMSQLGLLLGQQTQMLLILGAVGIVSILCAYAIEAQARADRRMVEEINVKNVLLQEDMRERTRAISEMSATLSRTLNFDKVLEAALEAGRAGMRANLDRRVVSAALLFNEHGELRVETSRGLTRNDDTRVLPGKAGIVGKALIDCVPVFGKDARKDPELEYLVGFQPMRSVLCIPLRANYDNFGVLLYGSEAADAFTEDHMDLLKAISTQATIALQNAQLYRNLLEEKERIVDVEEDARKKLARDLHDGPTQNVSAIAMRMSYIYRLLERKPEDVPEELKKVEELARKTTREIRHMLFTLRPLVLESQGLTAALDQLAEKIRDTHNQAVAVNVDSRVEALLDSHQQGVIFYIIEEAVGNARKHAEAELISVNVTVRGEAVVVEISDNGVGFDIGAVDANYDQRGSLGMVNMRERTELLDGVLRIDSAEGRGTTITVMAPLKSAKDSTTVRQQRLNRMSSRVPADR